MCNSLLNKNEKDRIKNNIRSMVGNGGTFTNLGIQKARSSFDSDTTDTKKIMIVLTDGATAEPVATRSEYINAANQGIEVLTVLYNMGFMESEINEYIYSCIGAGQVISADSGNIIDFFNVDAIRYVKGEKIGTQVTKQNIITEKKETVTTTIQTGAEDDNSPNGRREITIANCKPIDYALGKELKKLEEPTTGNEDYYINIADLTKMEAMGKVTINSLEINNDTVGYTMNLTLKKRPEIDLICEKKVKSIKVILSDGNTLLYKDLEEKNNIGKILSIPVEDNPTQYLAIMDDELLHGATLEIVYKIEVKNQNEIEKGGVSIPLNSSYTVYDYIDEEVSFNKEGSSIDWEIVDSNTPDDVITARGESEEEKEKLKQIVANKTIIKREFNETNGYEAELKVTRLLATNATDEYKNYMEIVKYENSQGRRIYYTIPANVNLIELYEDKLEEVVEKDEAKAEDVNIIPPFGRNNNIFKDLSKYIESREKLFLSFKTHVK